MAAAEALLDLIYEAAFLPEAWPAALAAAAVEGGAESGILFAAGSNFSGWRATANFEHAARRFVEDGWLVRNARTPMLLARNHPGFLRDADVFTDAELSADPMQVELLLPAGAGREVATSIPAPSGETIVFSLHRALARGAFVDTEVQRLDALRPHVARATMLAARLRLERMRAAVEILDAIGLPAAVLGPDAVVLASNALLDQVPHVRALAFSRLGLHRAQRQLIEAMATLERRAWERKAGSSPLSILLVSGDETPDAVLHIVPLRRQARDMMANAVALAVVTVLGPQKLPPVDLLHALFNLSAAEAKVARGLMNQSLGQLAVSSRLSAETIRSQLKSVLHKTGTRRQAELLALLTRVSAIHCGPSHPPHVSA